jgi:hypothetical protein
MKATPKTFSGFQFAPTPKPEVRRHIVSLLQAWRDALVWGKDRTFSIDEATKDLRIEIRDAEWDAMLALPRSRLEPVVRKRHECRIKCGGS